MKEDTGDMIRIVLIIGGGWLAYRYAVGAGLIPDMLGIGGGVPLPAGNGAGAGAGSGAGSGSGSGSGDQQGSGSGAGSGSGNGDQSGNGGGSGEQDQTGNGNGDQSGNGADSSLKTQVLNAAGSSPKQFWAWNYYLPADTPKPDPFQIADSFWAQTQLGRRPVSPAEVEATPLTIDQWWAMVQSAGLSGAPVRHYWNASPPLWLQ